MSILLPYGGDVYNMTYNGIKRLHNLNGSMFEKLPRFYYQTWFKDLPKMVFDEGVGVINNGFSDNIEHFTGDIKKRVIIILPGAFATTASLGKIKQSFKNENYSYYALNLRLTYFNYQRKKNQIIRETTKILNELGEKNQEVILFGYSYGGSIVESIGKKRRIDTISLSTGNDFAYTPFSIIGKFILNIIKFFKNFKIKHLINFNLSDLQKEYDKIVPEGIKILDNTGGDDKIYKIIEEFSYSVDLTEEQRKKCHILKGTYSHFSVNNEETIKAIMKGIDYFFNIISGVGKAISIFALDIFSFIFKFISSFCFI